MDFARLADFYRGKTVLVTGHTGFKGAWLSWTLLALGAKVVGISLPPKNKKDIFVLTGLESQISHHEFDIRNFERLTAVISDEKPDVVFHLAAQPLVRQSYDEPLGTFSTNVMGTVNLLEALRIYKQAKAAVIVTTDKVYENKEWSYGYREVDALGGHDPYSGSKAAADIATDSYRKSFFNPADFGKKHQTLIATVRAGNVIGGGDWSKNRLIPDIMRAVFDGNGVITLRNPGATRPWEHVLEPVSGYLMLGAKLGEADSKMAGNWNFGPDVDSSVSVGEVTKKTLSLLQKGFLNVEPDNSKHEAGALMLDVTKSRLLLGWKSKWNIEETLHKTVEWYKKVEEDPAVATKITREQISEYFIQGDVDGGFASLDNVEKKSL